MISVEVRYDLETSIQRNYLPLDVFLDYPITPPVRNMLRSGNKEDSRDQPDPNLLVEHF